MNIKSFSSSIPEINSWLLAAVFFSIPIHVAPAYILTTVILVLWTLEGQFGRKWGVIRREPLFWVFTAYFGIFLVSLLWTTDLSWGRHIVSREKFFLLFMVYFTVARPEHFWRYVAAFLLSIGMCEVLAYYNWANLHLWPQLPDGIQVDKSEGDTAPFVDRILYTPALALAGYLAGYQVLFGKPSQHKKWVYAALFFATIGNLLFSGGRAGLVGFLVLLALLVFQYLANKKFLALIVSLLLISAITVGGYVANDYFRSRTDLAISEVQNYEAKPNSSIGLRIVYTMNAWRIFTAHPWTGVGAGDYPAEYKKTNDIYTPQWEPKWNPHNQYMFVLVHTGILGGVLLLAVLIVPLIRSNPNDGREKIRMALPVLMITISLFESYLMRSNTTMMYVLFTAALWCGVREKQA